VGSCGEGYRGLARRWASWVEEGHRTCRDAGSSPPIGLEIRDLLVAVAVAAAAVVAVVVGVGKCHEGFSAEEMMS